MLERIFGAAEPIKICGEVPHGYVEITVKRKERGSQEELFTMFEGTRLAVNVYFKGDLQAFEAETHCEFFAFSHQFREEVLANGAGTLKYTQNVKCEYRLLFHEMERLAVELAKKVGIK